MVFTEREQLVEWDDPVMEAAPEGPDWLEQSADLIYIFSFIMRFSSAFFSLTS
jgi:hypothetical protein